MTNSNANNPLPDAMIPVLIRQPALHCFSPASCCQWPVLPITQPQQCTIAQAIYLINDASLPQNFAPYAHKYQLAAWVDATLPLAELIQQMLRWKMQLPSLWLLAALPGGSTPLQPFLSLGFDGFVFDSEADERLSSLQGMHKSVIQPLNSGVKEKLESLRQQVDDTDHQLIALLAQRTRLIEQLAGVKKQAQLNILQPARWSQVLTDAMIYAEKNEVSLSVLLTVLNAIHLDAVEQQLKHYGK
ncbi:MAG: chorismate mutase [Bacteroidia bacterium]|nr:chorismate mutase [Bacteroidia bacterium]